MSNYDHLSKDELVRLLERRDAERQLGLVWERDGNDADAAVNDDFVRWIWTLTSATARRPGAT